MVIKVDYRRRWKAIGRAVSRRGADAFLCVRPHNLRYLNYSGAPHSTILSHQLVTAGGQVLGLVSVLEANRLELSAIEPQSIVTWGAIPAVASDYRSPTRALLALCKAQGIKRLISDCLVPLPRIRQTEDDLVEPLRLRKDDTELRLMRRAAAAGDAAGEQLRDFVREGVTERQVAREVDMAIRDAGAPENSFPTIVASGPNAAHPHHDPTDRVLRRGDLVIVDLGACVEGYCSDMTRTLSVGAARGKAKEVFEAVFEAQRAQLRAVRANRALAGLDKVGRDVLAEYGFERYFCHSTGHGLGLEVHEPPRVSPSAPGRTSAGMVITIEPGVYIPGLGGARLEDDVVVRPGRGAILTRAPRVW